MLITVERSTGWMGSATKMQIIVNRERIATIDNNQVLDVELPDVKNNLKVRQFGISSNEIEVKDGDILEVKYKGWYKSLFPLMIAISAIMRILDLSYKSILFLQLLIVIISYAFKGLMIKKEN